MAERFKWMIRLILGKYCAGDYIRLGRELVNPHFWNGIVKRKFNHIGNKYHLEIPNFENIGANLVLSHPSCITVNPAAIIGKNCVLFKNVTIGSVRSGK